MPISFLNPWLWLGALALAAPLWLHLRRKQEQNLHLFSAVRFLDDQPQPRQSPLRLRNLLLFLLRALALLLVVAAFTWPFLRGANTFPIRESRVYILDNTLSHQAASGTLKDRDRILGEAARSGPEIQMAVVELASTPRVLVSFGDSRETLRERLTALQPSYQRGSYLAAFRQANSLLNNSLGAQKRIVFLGDNQENQWNESVSTPPFLRKVEVELPAAGVASRPNLSLADARVQRVFLGDKSLVNFTVKLNHLGDAKSATVTLRVNGQTIFNRPVGLDQQPPTILLQAQWEAEPSAWLRGDVSVEGTPDELPADNRVFFSLSPVIEGKVAVLAQSTYLRLALSPDIMKGQWAARLLDPGKLSQELATSQDADVLCMESSYLQSTDARKLLWRYLTNDRGVLLLVNRLTPAVTGALRELGFEAEGVVNPGSDKPERFQFVLSNHPIFHPFLSPDYGNLMAVKLFKYFRLQSAQAMPLIFGEHGDALFFQGTKLQGKLFVAAFGLDREHTSWPVDQTFIPFLDLALQTARAEDPTPTVFEPGEVAQIQLPGATTAHEIILRDDTGPIGRALMDQSKAQLRLPDKPGLYTVTTDDSSEVKKVFSVNPSPKESQLAYAEAPGELQAWKVTYAAESAKTPTATARISLATILQQRWWWWMVIAGLAALLLETVLTEPKRPHEIQVHDC